MSEVGCGVETSRPRCQTFLEQTSQSDFFRNTQKYPVSTHQSFLSLSGILILWPKTIPFFRVVSCLRGNETNPLGRMKTDWWISKYSVWMSKMKFGCQGFSLSPYIYMCVHVRLFAWAVHLVWSDQSQQLLSKHFCSKHHPRQKCMFIAVWKAKANASRSQCLVQINDKSNFFRQLSQPLARAWLRKTKGENHQSGDNGSVPFGDRGWFGLMSDGSHKKSSAAYSYYRRTKILRKFR